MKRNKNATIDASSSVQEWSGSMQQDQQPSQHSQTLQDRNARMMMEEENEHHHHHHQQQQQPHAAQQLQTHRDWGQLQKELAIQRRTMSALQSQVEHLCNGLGISPIDVLNALKSLSTASSSSMSTSSSSLPPQPSHVIQHQRRQEEEDEDEDGISGSLEQKTSSLASFLPPP